MFWLLLYGSFACTALWWTWRDEDLRWVGAWLVGSYTLSNLLFFASVSAGDRVGPYTFFEVMIAVAAAAALAKHPRWPIVILVCNLLSIAANIGLSVNNPPTKQQIYLWEVTTNICFAAECLLAIGAGGGYGRLVGALRARLPLRRAAAEPGVSREDAP